MPEVVVPLSCSCEYRSGLSSRCTQLEALIPNRHSQVSAMACSTQHQRVIARQVDPTCPRVYAIEEARGGVLLGMQSREVVFRVRDRQSQVFQERNVPAHRQGCLLRYSIRRRLRFVYWMIRSES